MTKTIGIWIGVFVATFAVLFLLVKYSAPKPEQAEYPEVSVIAASDHIRGNPDAKVRLIEYGDFQCPGCGQAEPFLQQLTKDYGDKLAFVYRDFPLPSHKHAERAARYAEAADLQGKYWEMHDAIFAGQNEWSGKADADPIFRGYAETIKLDMTKLQQDIESEVVKNNVEDDKKGATKFNVNSTPTFFLNTKKIQPSNYDEFKALIDRALSS
ncbi:MAG: thioredoxin domain-containing protein [Patescibacteria group bacterium]